MSYIETRIIKGRKYKYLRKSVRDGDKIKHITLKYLGPVDPVYKTGKKRGKTNASIYVRPLIEIEKFELRRASRSSLSFTRDRAKIILLSSQGFFARPIAQSLGCEERKVRIAIKEFNKRGLTSLIRKKSPGAPLKISPLTRDIVLLHFSKKPKDFGYHFTTWTLPRFRKHLIDYKVVGSISIEKIRLILMEAGAKLKRSKRWQYSPDKDFHKKNLQ